MPGSHADATSGCCLRAGSTEYVIDTGHMWPPSTWYQTTILAARATWAPARSSAHGAAWMPCPIATRISSW